MTYTDAAGNSDNQNFAWNVASAVTITDPGPQSVAEGASVSLPIQTTDATEGTLTFGETGLPPGLGISAQTGQITGTINAGDAASGPYTATITASDGTYSGSQTVAWSVAAAPAAAVATDQPTDVFFSDLASMGGNAAAFFLMPTYSLMAAEEPKGSAPEVLPAEVIKALGEGYNPDPEAILPIEPGALLDIGYGVLSHFAAEAITNWATKQDIKDQIQQDWAPNPQQFGKFLVSDDNTLQQQLGLGENLTTVEDAIKKDLQAAHYTSINFYLTATLTYEIINQNAKGQPTQDVTIFWGVELALWTSAKKGSQTYIMRRTLGSAQGRYNGDDGYRSDGPFKNYREFAPPPASWLR